MNKCTPSKNSQFDTETAYQKSKGHKKKSKVVMKQLALDQHGLFANQSTLQLRNDMDIIHLLINANLPLSLVSTPLFQTFFANVCPQAIVGNKQTHLKNKLPIMCSCLKKHVNTIFAKELSDCSKIGMMASLWKCTANQQYLNISIHYVNSDFKLRHFTVDFKVWQAIQSRIQIATGLQDMIGHIADTNFVNNPPNQNKKGKDNGSDEEKIKLKLPFIFPNSLQEIYMVSDGDHKIQAGFTQCHIINEQLICVCQKLETALQKAFDPDKLNPNKKKKKTNASDHPRPEDVIDALDQAKAIAGHLHQSAVSNEIIMKCAKKLQGLLIHY
jgi:hypothetical protein